MVIRFDIISSVINTGGRSDIKNVLDTPVYEAVRVNVCNLEAGGVLVLVPFL